MRTKFKKKNTTFTTNCTLLTFMMSTRNLKIDLYIELCILDTIHLAYQQSYDCLILIQSYVLYKTPILHTLITINIHHQCVKHF